MNEYMNYISYLAQIHLCFYHAELYSKIVDCVFRYFKVVLEAPIRKIEVDYRNSAAEIDFSAASCFI